MGGFMGRSIGFRIHSLRPDDPHFLDHPVAGFAVRPENGNRTLHSIPAPLEWDRVHKALKDLLASHGEHILRAKGLLQIVGVDQPLVLQAVHHTLYPPDLLSGWAGQPRESRLVIIVDGIEREIIDRAVAACSAAG